MSPAEGKRQANASYRVVVTGAAGMLGRAAVARCLAEGWDVYAVAQRPLKLPGATVVVADLSVPGFRLHDAVPEAVDAVIHLAAAVPHAASYPDTDVMADKTRRIDAAVSEAATAWDAQVVYASSCGLYDRQDQAWKDETAPTFERSPYFSAKRAGEQLFLAQHRSIIMRLSALYGAGLRRNLVLARFIMLAREGKALSLWGSGRREQDFLHADDAARFAVLALRCQKAGVYNVAAGSPVSMRQLAEIIVARIGGHIEMVPQLDPLDGETARYLIAKAHEDMNWKPLLMLGDGIAALRSGEFVA